MYSFVIDPIQHNVYFPYTNLQWVPAICSPFSTCFIKSMCQCVSALHFFLIFAWKMVISAKCLYFWGLLHLVVHYFYTNVLVLSYLTFSPSENYYNYWNYKNKISFLSFCIKGWQSKFQYFSILHFLLTYFCSLTVFINFTFVLSLLRLFWIQKPVWEVLRRQDIDSRSTGFK
jgi:hypothetical protein